jgi:hypothetical protein
MLRKAFLSIFSQTNEHAFDGETNKFRPYENQLMLSHSPQEKQYA